MRHTAGTLLLLWGLLTGSLPQGALAETSPFREACQGKVDLKNRPRTGLFIRQYPNQDQTKMLLTDVLDLAVQKLDRDLTFSRNLRACNQPGSDPALCLELQSFATIQIPQLVQEVRFHLALAQSPQEINSGFRQTDTVPNYRLRTAGLAKIQTWENLSTEEFQAAQQVLKKYEQDIINYYLKIWNQDRYQGTYGEREVIKASLLQTRFQHFSQYQSYLVSAPFLQYIAHEKPSLHDVLQALKEFELRATRERSLLKNMILQLSASAADSQIDTVVETALQYSSFLEFILIEKPELCGLAASITHTHFNRNLGTSLAVGLPLLTASIVLPGTMAYPIGILAGGYFLKQSFNELQIQKIRTGSTLLLGEDGSSERLFEAQKRLTTEVILFPMALVGGRMVGTSLRTRLAGGIVKDARLNNNVFLPQQMLKIFEKYSRR